MSVTTTFDMTFQPIPELIATVRKFVETVHEVVCRDTELGSQIAVSVHELLENASLHSIDGVVSLRIELENAPRQRVTITTRNRVRPDDAERVQSTIQEITVGDPMRYYIEAMRRPRRGTGGGLGLGRIAVESEMDLKASQEGDMLVVAASTRGAA
jgi:hypothetical protein